MLECFVLGVEMKEGIYSLSIEIRLLLSGSFELLNSPHNHLTVCGGLFPAVELFVGGSDMLSSVV
jgi:hypothetical protein